jgi:spore germination protein YaaH
MAIVTSWHGERFHPRTVRRLARDRASLARAAAAVARHAEAMRYDGLVLDLEALEPRDRAALLRVVREFTRAAHARGVRQVIVAVPATDTASYPAKPLLAAADLILPMLYDQHWAGGEPGPIADPAWVREALALRVREAGAANVVAALPTYGYRWIRGRPTENVSFSEAQRIATTQGTSLTRDAATQTLRARRDPWELWVTDATLLAALMHEVRMLGVSRIALWRLGQEDPAIWPLLKR